MIRSRWSKWLSGVGGVVLIGGLVLANYGAGVTPAEAHHDYKNPFKQILSKLNLILEKLNAGGGVAPLPSTGGAAGNYSMRWDTNKPSAERFTVLVDFGGAAVRDNNTGLVWEQAPDATTPPTRNWNTATLYCVNKPVGGTVGWRLPSVVELKSVQDASPGAVAPFVPANVITGIQSANYWSTTTSASSGTSFTASTVLTVNFGDGLVGNSGKIYTNYVWCVRGPMSESVY
jgi:Protein of unknown function (DUF1566)